MTDPGFGSRPTFASTDAYDLRVSETPQFFTLLPIGFDVQVNSIDAPPMASAAFSLALPVTGGQDGVRISFLVGGHVLTTPGATGYLVFSVNGQTSVATFPPDSDQTDFLHRLEFDGAAAECRMTLFIVVERGSADDTAWLAATTVDATIQSLSQRVVQGPQHPDDREPRS